MTDKRRAMEGERERDRGMRECVRACVCVRERERESMCI